MSSASEIAVRSGSALVEQALGVVTSAGADAADIVLVRGRSLEARVRGDVVDFVKQAQEQVLSIRVLMTRDGGVSSAVTSTSDLAPEAIKQMAQDAVALARATEPDPSAGLPEDGFATDWPDLALLDPDDKSTSADARIDDARSAEEAAMSFDPRITNSEGSQVGSDFSTVAYGNTAGFLGEYERASHSLFSEPIAGSGENMRRDHWMTASRTLADLQSPASVGRVAAERALRRLNARRIPTTEVPVIFESMQAAGLVRQLASLVSGYAVYRESSFLANKLGKIIAAPSVTIIDDGRLQGGLGSKPFDGEGLPTRRNTIIKDGKLETFLLDSYSGRKLGFPSTGNASRGAGGPPGVSTTNLWLEPGTETLEEIIARTDRGLLVTELMGMGFNPVTGDYSQGAAGLWIENGEIAYPVEEITIAGHFGKMLKEIDAIGKDLLWLGSVAAPPLRIASMTVAGE
ncbi:MAG: TldD/PmbA family protein [Myxococcales bacterium]|nr:TldD/PmbA family protein [Myxococcales bacterium]